MLVSEVFIRFFLWFTTHKRREDHEYFPDTSSKEASKVTGWRPSWGAMDSGQASLCLVLSSTECELCTVAWAQDRGLYVLSLDNWQETIIMTTASQPVWELITTPTNPPWFLLNVLPPQEPGLQCRPGSTELHWARGWGPNIVMSNASLSF